MLFPLLSFFASSIGKEKGEEGRNRGEHEKIKSGLGELPRLVYNNIAQK
jgi:hypothetical protein